MNKILTISIAAYNAENDISRCLDSLVNSGIIDKLDIIVVNDGSKDQTATVTNTYVDKFKDSIRLINKENGGHGSTINTSIELANGKYYKILDSDDWVESENMKKFIAYLESNEVDMVLNPYHEVSYRNHDIRNLIKYNTENFSIGKVYDISSLNENTVLFMHSLTFKTDVIKRMGSVIDEHCFYVDMEYCIFPMLYVGTFSHLDYPIYQYLLGSQTQSMNMQNLIKRRDQHLRVLGHLMNFYIEHESVFTQNIGNIILLRIKYAVYQQYQIYFNMGNIVGKKEVKEFDKWLKSEGNVFYSGVNGRFMKIVKFNRVLNFRTFNFFAKWIKTYYK